MPSVPAARQTLQILAYLSRQAGPATAAAIMRDLDLPRSTVYHLLATLSEQGFVTHLPEDRRYALGVAAYELGTGYSRQAPLARVARVPLAELVDRTGHSAHLAVQHGREVVYVLEERAPGRPPLVTDVGVRLPAQLTASGRAILAALPPVQIRALFPDPAAFVLRTTVGPRSPSALRALLVDGRRRGYAVEDGEVTAGFASIASPVLDHSGHPVAGVALTFPAAALPAGARERAAAQVARTAATITRRIGGQP
jgi:DNA-binding IclR family transcriptional regulator